VEKNNLNNKLEKDTEKGLEKLNIGLTSLSGLMGDALDNAYASIDNALTPKKAAQYKAYMNKWIKLEMEGKHEAADELKKKFSEQF